MTTATACDTRLASTRSWISRNGSTTGTVEPTTTRKIASADTKSRARNRGRSGTGIAATRPRIDSISGGVSSARAVRDTPSSTMRCAAFASGAACTARTNVSILPRSTSVRTRKITASTSPQAMLQPNAVTKSSRTWPLPGLTTEIAPTNVSAMKSPNSSSQMASTGPRIGSSTSPVLLMASSMDMSRGCRAVRTTVTRRFMRARPSRHDAGGGST